MKLSIITVALNAEKTIQATLESVCAQKNIDLEYIVIDGYSSDATVKIISRFSDHLSKFISEKDSGIYDAMNKGLKLAQGDVVGLLNADDVYTNPYVLSSVMNQFIDPAIDAVYGDLEYFRALDPTQTVRSYSSRYFNPSQLKRGLVPAHPTLFLRKRVYENFGLFDTSYKIAGDFEFMARIFKGSKLNSKYLPQKMVRMQMGGVSTQGLKSTLLLLKENMRACRQNGIATNYCWLLSRYPRKFLEYFQ